MTIIHESVIKGDFNGFRIALESQAKVGRVDLNAVDDDKGRTALHFAATSSNVQFVELLLRQVNKVAEKRRNRNPNYLSLQRPEKKDTMWHYWYH